MAMSLRTTSKTVTFARPFSLDGLDETQPAGSYTVQTDEEPIEGLSFLAFRRVATVIFSPYPIVEQGPSKRSLSRRKFSTPHWRGILRGSTMHDRLTSLLN
jgi:hypothetical protein